MELEEGKLDETYPHTLKQDACKGLITQNASEESIGRYPSGKRENGCFKQQKVRGDPTKVCTAPYSGESWEKELSGKGRDRGSKKRVSACYRRCKQE